jgi:hypothetical protein
LAFAGSSRSHGKPGSSSDRFSVPLPARSVAVRR